MAQAQGSLSQVIAMREASFKTLPTTIASKKIYHKDCTLAFTQNFAESEIIRGSVRHPSMASRATTDVGGDIMTELNANTLLWFAACGSIETAITGATVGTALTTPTATIDTVNCIMTVTSTAHGLLPGDSLEIKNLTAPTSLNDKYFPVFDVPTANSFKIAIPIGTSSTFTLGSGTLKKVTAAGTTGTTTFKAGAPVPSYTIEKGFTDIAQYFKYTGCKLSTLNIAIPATGMVDVSSSWMGGAEATGATSFETGTPTDNGFKLFDALHLAAADVKEGGSAIAIIKSISALTIDNQLDGDTFVVGGQGSRSAINPGVYRISGSIETLFESMTLYDKAKNATETSLDVTFKRGTGDGSVDNESLQIVTPELRLVPGKVDAGGKGVIASFSFSGYYDNHADATALKIIMKSPILPGKLV